MNTIEVTDRKRRLRIVFGLTAVYLIAEIIGGIITNSLALLADAGHMLTDVAGLGLALFAMSYAERPATSSRTYGYVRAEILAALANAVVLIGISLYILLEAYQRFRDPPEVASGIMLGVAGVGLAVNVVGLLILRGDADKSLNMKGAYFEVLSDMLTSIGVIVAGVVMLTTGWYYADPLISAGIGLFIFPRTWALLRESVGVLLEGTPIGLDMEMVRATLLESPGVSAVHDLHVWTLTSGYNAMSVHVVVADDSNHSSVLSEIRRRATDILGMKHVTTQIEPPGWEEVETHL